MHRRAFRFVAIAFIALPLRRKYHFFCCLLSCRVSGLLTLQQTTTIGLSALNVLCLWTWVDGGTSPADRTRLAFLPKTTNSARSAATAARNTRCKKIPRSPRLPGWASGLFWIAINLLKKSFLQYAKSSSKKGVFLSHNNNRHLAYLGFLSWKLGTCHYFIMNVISRWQGNTGRAAILRGMTGNVDHYCCGTKTRFLLILLLECTLCKRQFLYQR